MTTKLVDRGWNKIKTNLKALQYTEITVGIQGQEARLVDEESGASLADIAVYNHFGNKHIPERPFLQLALDNNKAEILKRFKGSLKLITEGKVNAPTQLDLLGAYLVGVIQQEITNLNNPPNADSTIKRKGHNNPLIGGRLPYKKRDGTQVHGQTGGRLRQSVTYEIRY